MPFGPIDVFWIGVVPATVAALAMWICARLALRPTAAWTTGLVVSLFVGIVAQNLRIGWHTALDKLLHPRVAIDWLPWLVVGAAAVTLLAAYAPRNWQRWLVALAGAFALTVPLRLLAGSVYVTSRWTAGEKLGVLLLWSFLFAAWWLTLSLGRHNRLPLARSAILLLVALGISLTLTASGAVTLGELGGVAAAALFGTTAVAWATGSLADGPSNSAGPLAVMLGSLIFLGYYYSQLNLPNAALLGVSLAFAAGWLPSHWPERDAGQIALRAALALVPLALAAASAISTALANPYG